MSKPSKGTVTIELNGFTLVVTIVNGKRFFTSQFPEIAERFDGTEDSGEAIDLFEQLATATAATPPTPPAPKQLTLFDAIEEGIIAGESCEQNAVRQGWDSQAAAEFILAWLSRHGPTSGEVLVSEASRLYPPHDARAFGPVFRRLSRRGLIEKCGHAQRAKGHSSAGAHIWQLVASQPQGPATNTTAQEAA